jgi:anti-anti-sigma factor
MIIERITENGMITLALNGELTAMTAERLDAAVASAMEDTDHLTLDFKDLEYVASMGLRVLLNTRKALGAKGGKFIIRNVSEDVMNILKITGLNTVLTIE